MYNQLTNHSCNPCLNASNMLFLNYREDHTSFDSFFCTELNSFDARPWPSQRPESKNNEPNFVGAKSKDVSISDECPEDCRPRSHKDWKFC